MKFSRSVYVKAAAVALALMAAGTASVAQAHSNVFFSIGANVAPGVSVGVSNAPYYVQPAYPAAVYVQPQPVYVQPAPVYYTAPAYYVRPPVVVGADYVYEPRFYGHGHGFRHHGRWN